MQGILCHPRSPRNLLIMGSRLMRGHISVICERSLIYSWHRVCVWSSPYYCRSEAKKTSIHQTSSVVCREAISDQARLNRLNLTTYRILDIRNTVIGISLVPQFLSCPTSTLEIYVIESINTLTNISSSSWFRFLFLQDSGHASEAIIISTSSLTSLKPDESSGASFHIWILPSLPPVTMTYSYIMRLNQYEKKKVMDKLTSSSGNIERMIPVWQFFRSEWRIRFPIDFVGSLGLNKPGGVMNAASRLGNVRVMSMNGKQSLLLRSHV